GRADRALDRVGGDLAVEERDAGQRRGRARRPVLGAGSRADRGRGRRDHGAVGGIGEGRRRTVGVGRGAHLGGRAEQRLVTAGDLHGETGGGRGRARGDRRRGG